MYHIAGLNFLFKPDIAISNPVFHKYITDDNNKADTVVNFIKCKQLASPDGMLLLNDVIKWYINDKTKNSYFAYYPDISDTKKMVCRFDFDYEWKNVTISYLMDAPNIEYLIINLFGNLIMRNLVLFHKGIILHASARFLLKWTALKSRYIRSKSPLTITCRSATPPCISKPPIRSDSCMSLQMPSR